MYGIFIIFLFYAIGILISKLFGEIIPGSVIGMVLLFVALLSGVVKADKVKPVAGFITRHMALFFVPVGVGLMVTTHYFKGATLAIITASAISTILVMISVGLIQQFMEKKND
ncbi:CidA/LrgA family protein [Alkalitalea saponilacus]|uniref:Holin-like protein n=1 Tax=Alkalitalea saponilacus TaxID=889453 RepID=A0A1T5HS89_9BACT|nr:CidA/LrgA family protein [Alkalitalea saponilacus]ASB49986.1 CidA/LrgA family protein [Alkalitalea saponilacus]SKC23507.1 holin-like protein [Alkalitalea saponilacus]